jgi:hypothetical protein
MNALLGPVGRKERGEGHDEQLANNANRSSLTTEAQGRWDLASRSRRTRSKGEDGAVGRWTRIPLLSKMMQVALSRAHERCTEGTRLDCIGRWQVSLDMNSLEKRRVGGNNVEP